jgi:hypothetical protein
VGALAVVLLVAAAVAFAAFRPLASVVEFQPMPFATVAAPDGAGAYELVPAEPPSKGWSVDFRDYPSVDQVVAFCRELGGAYPELVCLTELGRTYEGRPIVALRLGSTSTGDPDTRPALEIDGQHHAREPIGQQAVLYTAWHLVSGYGRDPLATHLLDTRTVYVVPSVNPDGNEIFLNQHWAQRKNARPVDDDGDGLKDEDPYDGVIGWDVCQAVEVTFRGGWLAAHRIDPFAPGWGYSARRNYLGYYDLSRGEYISQIDSDHDGKVNEDLIGGVDLNRNYPGGWIYCSNDPNSPVYRGTEPFSEPETRAVRDLVVSHPNIRLAVSYHSGDDRLAVPGILGSRITADAQMLETVGIKASEITEREGYPGTRHQFGTGLAPGETRAWLYERGIVAWLVEAYADNAPVTWTWTDQSTNRMVAYFNTGLQFNPPPSGILDVCRRWLGLNLYLLAAVPCPRIGLPSVTGKNLQIPAFNDGLVPVAVTVEAALGGKSLGRREVGELGASGVTVSLPLEKQMLESASASPGQPLTITITAGGPSREYPAPPLVSSWTWQLPRPDSPPSSLTALPRSTAGPPSGPFLSLGDVFGPLGWDADHERWDTPAYHLSNYVRPGKIVP